MQTVAFKMFIKLDINTFKMQISLWVECTKLKECKQNSMAILFVSYTDKTVWWFWDLKEKKCLS